jgi:hypothetical protein
MVSEHFLSLELRETPRRSRERDKKGGNGVPDEPSQNFIFSPNEHRGQLVLKKTINFDYIHPWFRAVVEEIQRSRVRREKSPICPCLPPPPIFLQTAIVLLL